MALDPSFPAYADEIAGRLGAAGLSAASDSVRQAARVAKADPLRAEEILREAAADIMEAVPVRGFGCGGRVLR